jgi:CheY-like chemotaxis protein
VDDEVAYIDLLQQLLGEHLGCPLHSFNKPADALKALPGLNAGLIITDYQMPNMNGLEFIAEVQKLIPNVPVVMITAYQLKFTPQEMARVPALKAVIRKPFKWTTLADHVVAYWPDSRPPAVIGSDAPANNS